MRYMEKYGVVIIGSGPAGLSAAIYLSRAKIGTLVIGKKEQSQLMQAYQIENYFGFPDGITGTDLIDLGIKQTIKSGVTIKNSLVTKVKKVSGKFKIETEENETFLSDYLIIASGSVSKLEFIKNLKLKRTKDGIRVNRDNKTSEKRVYSVGNCNSFNRQIVVDVGEGCMAALSIIKEIKKKKIYHDYGLRKIENENK